MLSPAETTPQKPGLCRMGDLQNFTTSKHTKPELTGAETAPALCDSGAGASAQAAVKLGQTPWEKVDTLGFANSSRAKASFGEMCNTDF